MTRPILEIRDLKVSFGSVEAVRGVSFAVERGSFTSLVGESGSGKSVTALGISGLLPVSARKEGSVLFRGRDGSEVETLALSGETLRIFRGSKVGTIFQDPGSSLNPVMRAGEQVREACVAHRSLTGAESSRRARELLGSVGIGETERVYRSYPHELSGGQRQRVMIAMALASDPELLVADEPTTALDSSTEALIVKLLDDLRRERSLSVLFITHDLGLALGRSGQVFILRAGRVEERLVRAEAFAARGAYARALLAARLAGRPPKTFLGVSDASS